MESINDINKLAQDFADDYNEYPTADLQYEILNVKNGDGFTIIRRNSHVYAYPNTGTDVTLMGDDAEIEVWKSDKYSKAWFINVKVYTRSRRCGSMTVCFREFELDDVLVTRQFI